MNATASDGAWIRRLHRGPDHGPTLVCLPHAGGSASFFRPWAQTLGAHAQVLAIQYPGRQDRMHDRCPTTIAEYAEEVFSALAPLGERPLAFFGHSMGAMIAFEVATRMTERLGLQPSTLFVSARRAPSTHRDDLYTLDDRGIVEELKLLSGTDMRILDDPEILRMVLPSMRNDYAAVRSYEYRPGPVLDCPVIALMGADDPRIDTDEAAAWSRHTTGRFALHTFTGGHFYLAAHQRAVADLILRSLLVKGSVNSSM